MRSDSSFWREWIFANGGTIQIGELEDFNLFFWVGNVFSLTGIDAGVAIVETVCFILAVMWFYPLWMCVRMFWLVFW